MTGALLILAVTVVTGIVLYILDRRNRREQDETATPDIEPTSDTDEECCGLHAICEKGARRSFGDRSLLYYDDEELDRFAGRAEDDYTDAEIEEFRDVMFTLKREEVADWEGALRLRGINPPSALRDELIMLISNEP